MSKEKILVYQLAPITWGTIRKMKAHLRRIKELGATHIWLLPIYPSPRGAYGRDVSDYMAIDERFGTIKQFDDFVKEAHQFELKVLMDLSLNHTSIEHSWVKLHPNYYIWNDNDRPGWRNLSDRGPAWELYPKLNKYYCHLFDKSQIDLRWFFLNGDNLNLSLVSEFRKIVKFWQGHNVDGFGLEMPQAIGKDCISPIFNIEKMAFNERTMAVLNAVFRKLDEKPFLIMEIFDTTYGYLSEKYVRTTPVNYCVNLLLEKKYTGFEQFYDKIRQTAGKKGSMLALETYNTNRFTNRSGMLPRQIAQIIFNSKANAICLYQGQELGLENSPQASIPVKEYAKQIEDQNSALYWYTKYIADWSLTGW